MGQIVLLQDLIDQRARKQEELTRYTKYLDTLRAKVALLNKEIALTETIIDMVRKEEIIDLSNAK